MSIQCSASLNVQIPTGPNFAVSWPLSADAFDRATVTVAKGKTAKLELQPAGKAESILLLVITSPPYSGKVKYNFGGPDFWQLSGPQIISGTGLMNAVKLSNTLTVNNTEPNAVDVTVDVLVLRTALTELAQ
jgi:hypothetical protein